MEIEHPQLGIFIVQEEIGRGSFAKVYLARHSILQYPVAIKIFDDSNNKNNIHSTFNITKSIVHPFICQDFDLIKTKDGKDCLFMEYVQGKTLLEYANKKGTLPMQEIQKIFGQLILAIDYLHMHDIIHRDLKCENVMIDGGKNVRLIDLNFSCPNYDSHTTLCGSPGYIAPEIIEEKKYNNSIDIWSLGVIIYAITFGKLPFENKNYSVLFKLITTVNPSFPNNPIVSSDLVDLIKKMLIKNPDNRIKIKEIKEHPFFSSGIDVDKYDFDKELVDFHYSNQISSKVPEIQIFQQMKLSNDESIKAIDEIKAGKITYNSLTYKILYKQLITHSKSKHSPRFILSPVHNKCRKAYSESDLPILSDSIKIEKRPSLVHFSKASQSENYIYTKVAKQIGPSMLINGRVQYRRFSSMAAPLTSLGKKNIINVKIPSITNANNNFTEKKLNSMHITLPQTFEEN